ncbi:hypothetical protein GCM10023238_39070 [Streptomyces heliomycini]
MLAAAHNEREAVGDPTAHAEVLASAGRRAMGCGGCPAAPGGDAGAVHDVRGRDQQSRVDRVVYGAGTRRRARSARCGDSSATGGSTTVPK